MAGVPSLHSVKFSFCFERSAVKFLNIVGIEIFCRFSYKSIFKGL